MNTRQLIESDYGEVARDMDTLFYLEEFELPDIIHKMLRDGRAELSYRKPGSERKDGCEVWFPKLTEHNDKYCYQLTWYNHNHPEEWPYGDGNTGLNGMNYDLEKHWLETGELDNESLEDHGYVVSDPSTHSPAIAAWYSATETYEDGQANHIDWPEEMPSDEEQEDDFE